MSITITSQDERARFVLEGEDVNRVASDAMRLVLADRDGHELHFGCGAWVRRGIFVHVATYTTEGREPYAFWMDVEDALEGECEIRDESILGPRLSHLAVNALEDLAMLCNQRNGFAGDPERKWAVETLRALWYAGSDRFDPGEVVVYAATHGWSVKEAKRLGEIAEGVRNGKSFRDYARRAIRRDPAKEAQMVSNWRNGPDAEA
jgi:hypothetical protein